MLTGPAPRARSVACAPAKALAAFTLLALAAGCQSYMVENPREPLVQPAPVEARDATEAAGALIPADETPLEQRQLVDRTIAIPRLTDPMGAADTGGAIRPPRPSVSRLDAVVPPLALPEFIDVVFGQMLGVPFVTGEGVAERTDLIQLRSSGEMSASTFLELVSSALEQYGVRVVPGDGLYRLVEDSALLAEIPRFIQSRARPETPAELRPIVQFVELNALAPGEMISILRQAFPSQSSTLQFQPNVRLNTITLVGLPEDIDAALSIILQMDELTFAGTDVIRLVPTYWDATAFADQLSDILTAEGWQTSLELTSPRTIFLLPVEFSNDVFVFARSQRALSRVRFWAAELDQPARTGDTPQLFVYDVQNTTAAALAEVANAALLAAGGRTILRGPNEPAQTGPAPPSGSNAGSGEALVVDEATNRLIFAGTASEYERLLPLMRQLDRAPREVLIEATIAEVTLTDATRFGVEFFADSLGGDDFDVTLGNEGLGLGSGGVDIGFFSGNVTAALNAFIDNDLVNVLSTPRVIARSGSSANIQVGRDIPIITSQRAADTQDGTGQTDILQSVSYRSTGVILNIDPLVYSDNRVDLTVSQEVSTSLDTQSAGIASPTISNRSISTQLTLDDGQTAVLGGLISTDYTTGETGAPILKDLPVVGSLFSASSATTTRTELLVLITAYVIRDGEDQANIVRALGGRMQEYLDASLFEEGTRPDATPRLDDPGRDAAADPGMLIEGADNDPRDER